MSERERQTREVHDNTSAANYDEYASEHLKLCICEYISTCDDEREKVMRTCENTALLLCNVNIIWFVRMRFKATVIKSDFLCSYVTFFYLCVCTVAWKYTYIYHYSFTQISLPFHAVSQNYLHPKGLIKARAHIISLARKFIYIFKLVFFSRFFFLLFLFSYMYTSQKWISAASKQTFDFRYNIEEQIAV